MVACCRLQCWGRGGEGGGGQSARSRFSMQTTFVGSLGCFIGAVSVFLYSAPSNVTFYSEYAEKNDIGELVIV